MRINRKKLKELVTYSHNVEPEFESPEGYFDSGIPEYDKEDIARVYKETEQGNMAAWCIVTVKATALGITASDSLGCCSYDSLEQIELDLLPEMQSSAFDELALKVQGLADSIPTVSDNE